jgi:hypothetical protein
MPTGPSARDFTLEWCCLYQLCEAIFAIHTWNLPSEGKEALRRLDERIKTGNVLLRLLWELCNPARLYRKTVLCWETWMKGVCWAGLSST